MAYIPDEAIERAAELSPSAWLLYCHLCRRRNHSTGEAFFDFERMRALQGVSRSNLYRGIGELRKKAWAAFMGQKAVLLVGDFGPVDRPKNGVPNLGQPVSNSGQKVSNMRQPFKEVPALLTSHLKPAPTTRAHDVYKGCGKQTSDYNCTMCMDTGQIEYGSYKSVCLCQDPDPPFEVTPNARLATRPD